MPEAQSKRPKAWQIKLPALPRQPFLGLALAGGAGIILADLLPIAPATWPLIGLTFLFSALAAWRWPHLTSTYAVVGCAFFLLHVFQIEDTPGKRLAAQLGERSRPVTAIGAVVSEPKIAPNEFATFLFKLSSVELEGRNEPSTVTWMVRWRGAPQFGDEFKYFGMAEPIAPPRNPGEFDMRAYLARQDVRRTLFVRYAEDGVLLRHAGGNPILRAAQKSRAWMQQAICRGLDDAPEVQTFLSGIVLGLRHQTPEDIEEPFQQTGTLHLFAVAGLHVGIVARLLWMLGTVAQLPRKWAAALIIPLVLFYSAVTGLHVSSVRAAVMSSVLIGAFFFERRPFVLNSLAAAAFFILSWDTNQLFSAGFQLSFAVVGAIVLLADLPFGFLRRATAPDEFLPHALLRGPRYWLHVVVEWLARGASVSFAAFIGSLPLILWYFYLFTPISLVANLVVVPIAFFVLAIALLSVLSATLLPWLAVVFNNANWCLARIVIGCVHFFAHIPGGHYYVEHPRWPEKHVAEITVLDVGAGAAVHLRTLGGEWLLDCGSERDYERVLRPYLHAVGVNRLAGALLSHGDSLHIGGAAALLEEFPHLRLIDNVAPDRSSVHQRLRRALEQRRVRIDAPVAGQSVKFADDVTARLLHPPRDLIARSTDDQAFVAQITIAQSATVLFMFDSGYATENALLGSGENLRSDILIKGQHHSGNSGSEQFLDAVQPRLIVATSRDFPESERISEQWAERVRARAIKLFPQNETGAVELRFREHDWEARAYITGETFRSASR
jgi:competence protein ComEC